MPTSIKRYALVVLAVVAGLAAILFPLVFRAWKTAVDRGGQEAVEPFQIAGNFYYVGAQSVSVFLITGPEGHVLLDAGPPGMAPIVIDAIAKLGFDIKDVKVLLNSDTHGDHAGGLAALQQASGAELWASDASAAALASGGDDEANILPIRALAWTGVTSYPHARVDHRFTDGETIHVGPIALTAHITGASTRGCTSWSFPVRDGDRVLNALSVCGFDALPGMHYPDQAADLERSVQVLRSLPVDIWVTSTSRTWGRYRKFAAKDIAKNPVEPFIDPDGYHAYLDEVERTFRPGP